MYLNRENLIKYIVTFFSGIAVTLTFIITVLWPTLKKDVIPKISPELAIAVNASLITDMDSLIVLEHADSPKKLVFGVLPIFLTLSNKSEFMLTINKITAKINREHPAQHIRMDADSPFQPLISTWEGHYVYTGGAQESYSIFKLDFPASLSQSEFSLLRFQNISDGSLTSKHQGIYYKIPAYDSDVIAIYFSLNTKTLSSADPANYSSVDVYDIDLEIEGVLKGSPFKFVFNMPYGIVDLDLDAQKQLLSSNYGLLGYFSSARTELLNELDATKGDSYEVIEVASTDVLNAREKPGVVSRKIGEIPSSSKEIKIIGEHVIIEKAEWVPIKYKNILGWVNSRFLRKY